MEAGAQLHTQQDGWAIGSSPLVSLRTGMGQDKQTKRLGVYGRVNNAVG